MKIRTVSDLPNVFDHEMDLQPGWDDVFFGNHRPLILELGCGYGEFCVELAKRMPDRNFIGLDIKGARIWRGASIAAQEKMSNVAFLRTPVERIDDFFAPESVQEIWITFPDPYSKKYNSTKRLTSPFFLAKYGAILVGDGILHLKTDDDRLYDYTLRTIAAGGHHLQCRNSDLHAAGTAILPDDIKRIVTHYEQRFIAEGVPIRYLSFCLNSSTYHTPS